MITIQNYKRIEGVTFRTKSNTQEWSISKIEQNTHNYQMVVLPKDSMTGISVLSEIVVYTLQRVSDTPDGYKMINTKNKREVWVNKDNLTLDSFVQELMIQTELNQSFN